MNTREVQGADSNSAVKGKKGKGKVLTEIEKGTPLAATKTMPA